jgi:hypothetical protein
MPSRAATAVAVLALAACSPGLRRDAAPTTAPPTTAAPATSSPAPSATPAPEARLVVVEHVTGDVDGDGRGDTVELVESLPDRAAPRWRWGVRARMTTAGTSTVWHDYGAEGNEGQTLRPVADVDGDGRGEVVVSPGTSAYSIYYELVTLAGARLVRVAGPPLTVEGLPDHLAGWGCARRLVFVATGTSADGGRTFTGTRTYYRLAGTRLVRTERRTDRWRTARAAPREYASEGC